MFFYTRLACSAFEAVFQKRQTKFGGLLRWLAEVKERKALRAQAAGLRGPGGGGEFVVALAAGGGAWGLRGVGGRGGEVGWWWGGFAGEDGRGGMSVDGGFGAGRVAV